MAANDTFPQNPVEEALEPADSSRPGTEPRGARRSGEGGWRSAIPVAIGIGLVGLAVFGLQKLFRSSPKGGSFVHDALRTAALSAIGALVNRGALRLTESAAPALRADD